MMEPGHIRIHAGAEFRKAIGHLRAAMEFFGWLNYHGAPPSDCEHEERVRKLVDKFIQDIKEEIE